MDVDKNHSCTYLAIMIDSIRKKEDILEQLLSCTKEQNKILSANTVDIDAFNKMVEEKEILLRKIQKLDDGFEQLYLKVQEELKLHKALYQEEIKTLQLLITAISEKGIQIETLEQANRMKFELYLSQKRNEIKQFKVGNKTVSNYYKNMSGKAMETSYFLDKKK